MQGTGPKSTPINITTMGKFTSMPTYVYSLALVSECLHHGILIAMLYFAITLIPQNFAILKSNITVKFITFMY